MYQMSLIERLGKCGRVSYFKPSSSQGWGGPGALMLPGVGRLPTTTVTDAFPQVLSNNVFLPSLGKDYLLFLTCLLVCNKCRIFYEVPISRQGLAPFEVPNVF